MLQHSQFYYFLKISSISETLANGLVGTGFTSQYWLLYENDPNPQRQVSIPKPIMHETCIIPLDLAHKKKKKKKKKEKR